MFSRTVVLSLLLASACGGDPAVLEPLGTARDALSSYYGWVTTSAADAYVNRCATDPVNAIKNLTVDPTYVMGFRSGSDTCSVWAPTTGAGLWHHQGIQRLTRGGYNYLVVTDSVNGGYYPGFEVIRLGSKTGTTGSLGGNVTPHQLPPCADAVVRNQADTSTSARDHAGGLQVSGEYAIISFEASNDSVGAGFRIAKLTTPTAPVWGPLVLRSRGQTTNAGEAMLTRLSNGKFLAVVLGNDADDYEVFVSSEAAMPYHGSATSTWVSQNSGSTPFGSGNYQNLQLVTRCSDGQLYAAATHKNGTNEDWVDLWQVDFSSSFAATYTKVANRHMYCSTSNTGNTRYCDFDAGAGIYVNGTGGLILYGVEHYNDGYPSSTRAVKVREFP